MLYLHLQLSCVHYHPRSFARKLTFRHKTRPKGSAAASPEGASPLPTHRAGDEPISQVLRHGLGSTGGLGRSGLGDMGGSQMGDIADMGSVRSRQLIGADSAKQPLVSRKRIAMAKTAQ